MQSDNNKDFDLDPLTGNLSMNYSEKYCGATFELNKLTGDLYVNYTDKPSYCDISTIQQKINKFEEMKFIAGDYKVIEFQILNEDTGEPVDLTTFSKLRWVLAPYGNTESPVLDLKGEVDVVDKSVFIVKIKSEYSENLNGLYIHQPVLYDTTGKEFRPAQGLIEIKPRANGDNSIIIEQ